MFELTFLQEDAGGNGATYTLITPGGALIVTDVTKIIKLSKGQQAVLINYRHKAWIYRFDLAEDPPQNPKFVLFKAIPGNYYRRSSCFLF